MEHLDGRQSRAILHAVSMPVDVTDERAFPNMARAERDLAKKPADYRANLQREWL